MADFVTTHFVMKLIEYTIYLLLVIVSSYQMYEGHTTKQERKSHRTRIAREIEERREKMVEKSARTTFASKLEAAGNPLLLTAFKFQIIRYTAFALIVIYYVIIPLIAHGHLALTAFGLAALLFVVTSPGLNISLTNVALNKVIEFHNRRKHIELFTLFDMLKAELKSLNDNQHVNVYHLLNDSMPYFDYINNGIMKFLRYWKTNPDQARKAFAEEIGGDHAEQLASILFKLDETSRNYAVEIIDGASKVFSTDYFESMNRRTEGKSITFNVLFFGVNILTLIWLVVMVVSMFSSTFKNTNIGGF